MTIITRTEIECLDGYQNDDRCLDYLSHDPKFEWSGDDLAEFAYDREVAAQERLAMAGWWEMEGVRCATFGRDPNVNPYL